MNTLQYTDRLKACTELEIAALRSAFESSEGNGHDFGYSDDVTIPGKSKQVVGGVISSLLKKDLMSRCDDEFGQIWFGIDRWPVPEGSLSKYEYAAIVEDFLKNLDASNKGSVLNAAMDEKSARRKARRAARRAAKNFKL